MDVDAHAAVESLHGGFEPALELGIGALAAGRCRGTRLARRGRGTRGDEGEEREPSLRWR
jgi:hypothetical protein